MSSIVFQNDSPNWWRSLDELAGSPRFRAFLEAEFPDAADPPGMNRRRWLQLMGASLALAGISGCRWERQEIAPFANRPLDRIPGTRQHFATAMPTGSTAHGIVVTTVDGRPIKIEGNPRHPQSLGATNVFAQAAVLELYDPDRSCHVYRRSGDKQSEGTWEQFTHFCQSHFGRLCELAGDGLCVLSQGNTSPTLDRIRHDLRTNFPSACWFEYEAISDDNEREGARIAFGKPLRAQLALDKAQVILCLDADLLGSHPASVRHARDFSMGREANAGQMNRLYAVESRYSLTGAAADHRLPLPSCQIPAFVGELEQTLAMMADSDHSVPTHQDQPPSQIEPFVRTVVRDLLANGGRSIVAIGSNQSPAAIAAVHRINARLGNEGKTVIYTQTMDPDRPAHLDAIKGLVEKIRHGNVNTLLILGGNPVYNAPADLAFAEAIAGIATTIHLSSYRNETSRQCSWHLPQAHFLETWGDARAWDGTYSILQPAIAPLYGGRSEIEVLAMILAASSREQVPDARMEDLVRRTFQQMAGDDPVVWDKTLRDGLLIDSAWKAESVPVPGGPVLEHVRPYQVPENGSLEITFWSDLSVGDGRFANSSWLQELPDPMTKITWDNAALVNPETACRLGIENETKITIQAGGREMTIPAYILPGQAPGSIGVALGYGRTAAGHVGGDTSLGIPPVGVDAYLLRTTDAMTILNGAHVKATGIPYRLATTQDHHAIDAVGQTGRDKKVAALIREANLDYYREHPDFAQHVEHHPPLKSLWEEHFFDGHRWGMSIDLSKCIGCGACIIACQAENNIPVVGKEQVLQGREMQWLRVDRYFRGPLGAPQVAHQPIPCQQCELAPCEQVCPVAATIHSQEGLNDMVYNRCVGTRYCANNCPYKVRRFNYLNYHKDLGKDGGEVSKMKYNPDVTIRCRGVMEKCTYCVQRIQTVKIEAKKRRLVIRDGEIQTACQQVCPSQAIHFGNIADQESTVSKKYSLDRAYALLSELNIRPRTVYLARISNPNPDLEKMPTKHASDHT
ncbi:MAG: TAT-variant-translocated molybdopterin oxidoreductase [Pirellulales bacterium]|nr:TAT-variant-translocated molybdopterin oxidoreductase [Pirellulales bacterium]